MNPRLIFFMVVRVIGWLVGIGAVIAYAQKFEGNWSYFYGRENFMFCILMAGFLDLLYHHVKLVLKVKEGSK